MKENEEPQETSPEPKAPEIHLVTPQDPNEPTVLIVDVGEHRVAIPATNLLHTLMKSAEPCWLEVRSGLQRWHDGKDQLVTASRMPPEPPATPRNGRSVII